MTDEEKAVKAICEKCPWKGINGQCFEHASKTCGKVQTYIAGLEAGRKENAELKEKLKGFESGEVAWQCDMDATIKQNIELKETVSRAGYRIAELKHEIDELKAHCKAVDEVNERMKCCVNCKSFDVCAGDYLKRGFHGHAYVDGLKHPCNKWELEE